MAIIYTRRKQLRLTTQTTRTVKMNAKLIKTEVRGPYPKNGNVTTQAKTFRWSLVVGGKIVLPMQARKSDCVECAREMGIAGILPIETVLMVRSVA